MNNTIINKSVKFWSDLIKKEINSYNENTFENVFENTKLYYIEQLKNFNLNLSNNIQELLKSEETILLQCIGSPSGMLRKTMLDTNIDLFILKSKVIEMEITKNTLKITNFKNNRSINFVDNKLNNIEIAK